MTLEKAVELAKNVLNDEYGVSEETYTNILEFISSYGEEGKKESEQLSRMVDATDGRFYI